MEMQQVRYFLSVARVLNFTRAAEECNVTQPALTRAIKQLEDELGGDLIRREGRNTHLTDLGNRMQPFLQQCYESAQTAKLLATKIKKGEVPTLSLAVSRTLDLVHLMRSLSEMHRSFPGLQLKLRRGTGAQIAAMLKNGEVDLAVGGPMGESWDRLETWPMFSEAWLRPTEKPAPCPPTLVDTVCTSGSADTISSTCRILASLRARLEPTGKRMLSWVKPWSVCGMNSVPTSGASASAPTKLSKPTSSTTARGVSVAKRHCLGAAWMRSPCASNGRP